MATSASYSPIVSKLFRSRNIILNQLSEKRGFDVSDYKDFSVTEIYNLMKNDQLDMLLTNSTTGKKILCFSISLTAIPIDLSNSVLADSKNSKYLE